MNDVLRMIIEDTELHAMLSEVFNWRGHRDLCYEKINELADHPSEYWELRRIWNENEIK